MVHHSRSNGYHSENQQQTLHGKCVSEPEGNNNNNADDDDAVVNDTTDKSGRQEHEEIIAMMCDEWAGAGLPAIGEDTKMKTEVLASATNRRRLSSSMSDEQQGQNQADASAMLPRTRLGSFHGVASPNGNANGDVTVQRTSVAFQAPHMRRRRFHSSDMIIKHSHGNSAGSAGSMDSPTWAFKQWVNSSGSHVPTHQVGGSGSYHEYTGTGLPPARHRCRRRTLSETNAKSTAAFVDLVRLEADDDFEDMDDDDDVDSERGETVTRQRHASEDSNASSCSAYSGQSRTISRSPGSDGERQSFEKLLNLQKLYQEGFITVTEFKERRLQLVDELTMTTTDKTIAKTTDLLQSDLPIIYREPPDFSLLRDRDAIKHVFDSEERQWTTHRIKVKIDPQPFAKGGLRQVYQLQDLSVPPDALAGSATYVAKIAMDPNENPDTYFRDVEMQAVAAKFAKLYNSYNPPRRVEFLGAWILQLIPTNDPDAEDITMRGTICGVEPFIAGEYHKHNNNFGYVSELERNTPQAFSHFTYEASGHQILVVDIQGVGDHYTDPQIHTRRGKEFGKGNLSIRGFERFLESHRCNAICKYLKLPLNNPKEDCDVSAAAGGAYNPKGTVPAQPYMSQPRVRVDKVESELCHYSGDSTAFQRYQAKKHKEAQDKADAQAFLAAMKQQKKCTWCGIPTCSVS
ncbi:TPA: hypothetical protein N0F65_007561 [Lagenidium giganteum]|uniref:Alpha-type protein kinase domain-containing protein n=1 Tax=Lagenidium giganteum TaxID=4803 RepID=A0AAV2ZN84_9STRA|nr:TPA: hypothetical protein N0F65_007561 [Lagenidium giganteum]